MYIPVDIPNIEDLSDAASHLGVVVAHEFNWDPGLAQVGTHGEIGNGSDHGDGGRDVVEHAMGPGLGVGETGEGKGSDEHYRTDGLCTLDQRPLPAADGSGSWTYKIPVRAMGGDGNVGAAAVDDVVAVGDDGVVHTLFKHSVCCVYR